MATVRGTVLWVDVEASRTTAMVRDGTNEGVRVFVDTLAPAQTGDGDHDAQISTARKTALLVAAAWGLPVELDVDASSVVNYVILTKP